VLRPRDFTILFFPMTGAHVYDSQKVNVNQIGIGFSVNAPKTSARYTGYKIIR